MSFGPEKENPEPDVVFDLANPIVVFDLDGTLALIEHRKHLIDKERGEPDWGAFYRACVNDLPNAPVIALWTLCDAHYESWVVSGRSDEVRRETVEWLRNHRVYPDRLLMRSEGDFTPDDELKRRWIEPIKDRVLFAVDDRDKVVRMWRSMGVPCFQVADGAF